MSDDYKRLLTAAAILKSWTTPSQIATNLTKSGYTVSDQSMTNWKSRGLSRECVLRAASIIGCRPLWLESGAGPMTDDTSRVEESPAQYPYAIPFRPIIEWERPEDLPEGQYVFVRHSQVRFSAGNGGLVFEEEDSDPLAFTTRWVKSRGLRHSDLVAVSASGDSMEPTIGDGDKILINRAETALREGQIFAIRYGDELRIKRLYARYDGGLILRSDNRSRYPDQEIPVADVRHVEIIGRVIWAAGEM